MLLKQIFIVILATLAVTGYVQAQNSGNFRNQGYLLDNAGNSAVVKALGYDVCVRSTDWTPARALAECDPDLMKTPPEPAAKPAPKPTPKPAPALKPAPKPVTQKFSFSADTLFDFDKSVIKPEGMRKLDDLVAALRGAQYDSVVATGHTDRLGSANYNQRLSHRRAEAARNYLVEKGLDASRISAVGKGKTQPATKPADCKGKSGSVLHACLQPDRRVDIEVSGSKTIQVPASPVVKSTVKPEAKPVAK